jgi:hypothetical protein
MLNEEQHVQAAQEHRVDVEEAQARIVFAWASENARQVCPARLGAGSNARLPEDLPHRRRRERVA